MVGKRGQDLPIGTLILIIIGVVVLVVLILGFTQGFDFIFKIFDLAPGQDLETVLQACTIAVQANLRIDYCTFKEVEVNGEREYVNCEDTRINSQIQGTNTLTCASPYTAEEHCTALQGTVLGPSVSVTTEEEECPAGTDHIHINTATTCCV